MAVKDYTGQLIKTANLYRPQAKPVIDLAGALSAYKDTYQNTRDRAMQEAQQNLQQTKQDALANALKGGDEKEIAAAYAEYNPQAAMAQRLEEGKLSQQFRNQMALLNQQYQNQRGLEALKQMYNGQGAGATNAIKNYEYLLNNGVPKNEAASIAFGGNTEAVGGALANGSFGLGASKAYNQQAAKEQAKQDAADLKMARTFNSTISDIDATLTEIQAHPETVGWQTVFKTPIQRLKYSLGDENAGKYLEHSGKAFRLLGSIQNRLIAEAKAAGQSGINTLREIEQAVKGINEHSSDKEIIGALNVLRKISMREAEKLQSQNNYESDVIDYEDYMKGGNNASN